MSKVDIINDLQGALLTFFIKTKRKLRKTILSLRKNAGRTLALMGCRRKDGEKLKQPNIDEDSESFWHSLPMQKKRKPAQIHSLSAAVESNRAGSKKH